MPVSGFRRVCVCVCVCVRSRNYYFQVDQDLALLKSQSRPIFHLVPRASRVSRGTETLTSQIKIQIIFPADLVICLNIFKRSSF